MPDEDESLGRFDDVSQKTHAQILIITFYLSTKGKPSWITASRNPQVFMQNQPPEYIWLSYFLDRAVLMRARNNDFEFRLHINATGQLYPNSIEEAEGVWARLPLDVREYLVRRRVYRNSQMNSDQSFAEMMGRFDILHLRREVTVAFLNEMLPLEQAMLQQQELLQRPAMLQAQDAQQATGQDHQEMLQPAQQGMQLYPRPFAQEQRSQRDKSPLKPWDEDCIVIDWFSGNGRIPR